LVVGLAASLSASCGAGDNVAPLEQLYQPSGVALAPGGRYLAVANGNLDEKWEASSVVFIDLDGLSRGFQSPLPPEAELSTLLPCFGGLTPQAPAKCAAEFLIRSEASIVVTSGAASLGWQENLGLETESRLFVVSRGGEGQVVWADVQGITSDLLSVGCGQGGGARCGPDHVIPGVSANPASINVSPGGVPIAVIPHLEGGRLTLLDLQAPGGPAVVDVESGFFQPDPASDSELAGGFEVALRACESPGNAPSSTLDCERPMLYASERYWWGLRTFQVALGLDILVPGSRIELESSASVQTPTRPIGGGVKFEDPEIGDRLLYVQTTPPTLLRIDTSLDQYDQPINKILGGVPLCANPNHVELFTPESGERLALVSCFDADRVAVISLDTWSQVAAPSTGRGPDEIAVDHARKLAYVANAKDSSLSVLELDSTSGSYLREVARVGP